jgi:DNA-binding Lrp family transcriptional regulator
MSRIRQPRLTSKNASGDNPLSTAFTAFAPSVPSAPPTLLDEVDRRLINTFQGGFPICERPFQAAAAVLGLEEEALIARIEALLKAGILSRFGPLFNADRMGGVNVLAAMALPSLEFEQIVEFINLQPEIAHNYRREHPLNLWFVGAAETPEKVEAAFSYIESITRYPVYRFPKEREFFVQLKLEA